MTTRTLALVVSLAFVPPALAQLACGDVVSKGQKVTLTADVGPCDGGVQDAAIFVDGGQLDLGGRTVTCADTNIDGDTSQGIGLIGKKSRVTNGTVVGCRNGVFLAGDGKHLVQGVTVQGSVDDGLDSNDDAPKNKVYDSTFTQNGSDGVYLTSDKNKLRGVTSTNNVEDGIDLVSSADKNKIIESTASGNGDDGIEIGGSKNKALNCTSTNNAEDGFDFADPRNQVRGGTSQGNGSYDVNDCTGNKVKKLVFTTASPDCQ
jgi:parallel beta-helix repeat protein